MNFLDLIVYRVIAKTNFILLITSFYLCVNGKSRKQNQT